VVHPQKAVTNAGARPGDALVLTKPLGGGIVTLAATQGKADASVLETVVRSMTELNKTASETMRRVGVHAATDVTGFSFLGHASIMARASGADFEIKSLSVPVFLEALDLAEKGVCLPLGKSNAASFEDRVRLEPSVPAAMARVLFDPQTSGGLLISVEHMKKDILLGKLHEQGVLSARVVGSVTREGGGKVRVV
jgi:selenide,water dikinase